MLRLFNPPVYQGPRSLRHRKGYFEGWYYKFVTADNRSLAVIPGVSLHKEKEKSTAFIQIIDGSDASTEYFRFPMEELFFSSKPFVVSIGDNQFTLDRVELGDRIPLSGQMKLIDHGHYNVTLSRPGIMGWYRYMPFMECYHGVVSTGHGLSGRLDWKGESIDFKQGKGYIEKDWGTSFPSSYVWMQTNGFSHEKTSFMLSLARIPWFGSWFRGFLGFLVLEGRTITFSTYTGADLQVEHIENNRLSLAVYGKGGGGNHSLRKGEILKVSASRSAAGELMAPVTGAMDRRISESIDGRINVEFVRDGKTIFQEESSSSGLEIVGDTKELS